MNATTITENTSTGMQRSDMYNIKHHHNTNNDIIFYCLPQVLVSYMWQETQTQFTCPGTKM